MENEQFSASDHREQRMLAVAKLKRAASLPRLKDGRRPPMHNEGMSEGEKGSADEEQKPEADTPPPPEERHEDAAEVEADNEVEVEDVTIQPPASRSKRRSRSRSRSRGSKDLKGKARALQSPTPSPLIPGDSSQDEAFIPSPTITLPVIPSLMSPIPSNLQRSRLLRSPTPNSQDPSLFQYPGTSPPTPLPSLEALQKGLFRSNSAGRMLAMHKLTGGTETYESPSPTPPINANIRRNNTVSGGERNAARKLLMDTLGGRARAAKETDGEQGSGNDEIQAPSPSPTPKRRRRRSRRGSSGANTGISDSDFPSTSPNTPIVPPTPLPPSLDVHADLRARSTTPNQIPSPRIVNSRVPSPASKPESPDPAFQINGFAERDRPEPTARRRSVVVEEDEEAFAQSRYPPLPATPPQHFGLNNYAARVPNSSTAPSEMTDYTMTSGVGVPVYLSHRETSRDDLFPNSPFNTPLKERPAREEDEEEEVLYPADALRERSIYDNDFEREISWIASPVPLVPEIRMPIHDDDDDEGDEDEEEDLGYNARSRSAGSSNGFSPQEDISPRASSDSQNILFESELSPENNPSYVPPSPSSVAALSHTASIPRGSDGSMSPQSYPARLSVASPLQGERSPLSAEFGDLDDRAVLHDNLSKRSGDSVSTSTWEKVKSTFTRSNSVSGRRSRSNSIANRERREQTDSSISRESGASITGPRLDKNDNSGVFSLQQPQNPTLSPSASASILSLAPQAGSRVSPIPPASVGMSKYQSEKLNPFPGIQKLEEERNRAKGLITASASTPDVNAFYNGNVENAGPLSALPHNNPGYFDLNKDRGLVQQASDPNLVGKYFTSPTLSAASSSSPTYPDYFTVGSSPSTPNANSIKLPMTLPGVKQWLSKNNKKIFSSQGSPSVPTSPNGEMRNGSGFKKPSLSDLLRIRKDNELGTDWEELGGTSTEASAATGRVQSSNDDSDFTLSKDSTMPTTPPSQSYSLATTATPQTRKDPPEVEKTPKAHRLITSPVPYDERSTIPSLGQPPALPSPPDPNSTTPDPSSSLSDYPPPSTSDSSSSLSSHYSAIELPGRQGSLVLEKLEENLARGSRSPMWAAAIEDPSRKLILSSPVLQVVNPNTVKDRFLFLFSDILVIAKPVAQGDHNVIDRPTPERKFIVKSVVQLQNLRFCGDRSEAPARTSTIGTLPRNPLIRTFIQQFSRDPDHAIAALFAKSGMTDDPSLLGQLLFKTVDLDRVKLGHYLSQRTSKIVLKSFVDSFGFVSLQIDKALRVFLLSLHVPSRPVNHHNPFEYLLDAFASRWYEANARFVAYDKDLAVRLVRAIIQLNDLLHDGIAQYPGATLRPRRDITVRNFVDAFRRYDTRYLVSDELLEDIYQSIRSERLAHARDSTDVAAPPDILITIKRPLPTRITYKLQSDPIILRIPQPDPHLSIQLFGHDLIFDPPVLTFHKSSEVSFRITGNSLGSKTIIMCRSGPNALSYSGLPLGHSITIERAFMRNTFQVAFMNHCDLKRRYMFSVDDPLIRHQWTISLKDHIQAAILSSTASLSSASPGSSKFYRAAEIVAFKVLQETLIGQEASAGPSSLIDHAVQHLNSVGSSRTGSSDPFLSSSRDGTKGLRIKSIHIRSKSRSKVYLQSKAGRNELDIGTDGRESRGSYRAPSKDSPTSSDLSRPDAPLWTGRDLEMQCLQNSSIALVLSYLQVGSPEHVLRNTS